MTDVRVTHKYEATAPDELTIIPGEVIKNCKQVPGESGWMTGTLNGVTGLFPDNFVKVIDVGAFDSGGADEYDMAVGEGANKMGFDSEEVATKSAKKEKGSKISASKAVSSGDGAGVSGSDKAEKMFLVKYKYASSQPDELSLKVGDIIIHVSDCEPGWATGKINGKEGLYPTNFVVPCDNSISGSKSSEKADKKGDSQFHPGSKKSKSRSSDQHKRDSKTEPSDDEIDGPGEGDPASSSNLSLDVANSSSHETKSQSSLDDTVDSTQNSGKAAATSSSGGSSIIKTAVKKASKVLPVSHHIKSQSHSYDVTSSERSHGVKSTKERSGGVVDYNPSPANGAGVSGPGSRSWQGFKKGSKVNKSMDSLNSIEDEHENVSRGSKSSSTEMLSDAGLTPLASNNKNNNAVLTSPEYETSPTLPDTLFGSDIDLVAAETIPTTAVKKDIPRQNKKRPPTREKIRQDAEKAETDRAAAAESTLVQIQKPSPTESHGRLKVGLPIGPGGAANRFGGAPMPGMGANFLSELKNKQNKKDPAEHKQLSSPQTSLANNNSEVTSLSNNKPISSSIGVTVSSSSPALTSKPEPRTSPSNVGETRRLFGGGGGPGLSSSNQHLSDNHIPLKSSGNHGAATPPARPQKPSTGVKPSSAFRGSAPSSSSTEKSGDSIPAAAVMVNTPSSATTNVAATTPAVPNVANKPSRPPPPQVPEKPRAIVESGGASMSSIALKQSRTEVELRTMKDTVTRLERRIKELESQLEAEHGARVRLETKVDALLKQK